MTVPGGHNESGDGCVCGCMVLGVVARESVGGAFLTSRLKKRQRIHDSHSLTQTTQGAFSISPYEPSTIPHLSAGSDARPSILLI